MLENLPDHLNVTKWIIFFLLQNTVSTRAFRTDKRNQRIEKMPYSLANPPLGIFLF